MTGQDGAGSGRAGSEGDAARWSVLFDMDGLLVDSEPVWTVAEQEVAARLGGTFTAEAKAEMIGQRLETAIPILLTHLGTALAADADPAEVGRWMLRRMGELLGDAPPLMPGAARLLAALTAAGVPTGLVSSSYRTLVDAVLHGMAAAGVGHRFDVTLAGDEVGHAKPHPEPYRAAAALLGLPTAACVVLEDSRSGMASGVAAGCPVVLVPSVPSDGDLRPPGVALAATLEELDIDALRRLALPGAVAG